MEPARNLLAVVPGSFVSGAEMLLLRDLRAARTAGWSVRVACNDGPLVARLADEGIERVAIADLRLDEGRRALAGARLARATIATARTLRGVRREHEVLLVNGINALAPSVLARGDGTVVLFAHDVLVRRDRLALARVSRRRVRGAIAVSRAAAAPLRTLGIDTIVARQGTDWPAAVSGAAAGSGGPARIGIAAVVTPWKGHGVLLDALALLTHRDAQLEIIGATAPKDGAHERALRARAAAPDLAGRVQFVGPVPDALERMRTWTVAVSASTDPEAGPLTVLEAMSIGVPVVATAHGGAAEVLGDAGVLVPPNDAAAMAAAIDRLLDDTELYARCRAAGPRRIVEQHFTRAAHEQRFVAALEALSTPRGVAAAGAPPRPTAPGREAQAERGEQA
jgi:glycosyltransferase involved in cell wall biosynthesis